MSTTHLMNIKKFSHNISHRPSHVLLGKLRAAASNVHIRLRGLNERQSGGNWSQTFPFFNDMSTLSESLTVSGISDKGMPLGERFTKREGLGLCVCVCLHEPGHKPFSCNWTGHGLVSDVCVTRCMII